MEEIKIILDDLRPIDETYYRPARTYDDCIYALKMFKDLGRKIDYISLDFNLGGKKTGYNVLEFMLQNGNEVGQINIHSDDEIGKKRMKEFAKENFPHASVTDNPI